MLIIQVMVIRIYNKLFISSYKLTLKKWDQTNQKPRNLL
jgi:hypothetical protein